VKACPVVLRRIGGLREILAFQHSCAGLQLVKGGIEPGEASEDAALRELAEEAGITDARHVRALGSAEVRGGEVWHFHLLDRPGLPESWHNDAVGDDDGRYRFFWDDLDAEAGPGFDPVYGAAMAFIRRRLHNGDVE